ncbi:MAG: TIGR01620 family protein [Hyphomicrobiales bacterium]|nr:TIGR01620 family protein [Hyphomicrobiales bacterium]
MSDAPRRPRAFRVDAPDVVVAPEGGSTRFGTRTVIVPGVEPTVETPIEAALPRRAGLPWRKVFFAGLGGLVSLALGLAIDRLLTDLWARAEWLGWVGVACLALALVALLALAIREAVGLRRLARVERLREAADRTLSSDDRVAAPALVAEVDALYVDRPDLARARARLAAHRAEVVDGRDLVRLAETELMSGLDGVARSLILEAAKRVSVVTAISPRALVDIAYVAFENLRLMRRLADLYGGRPGSLGFLRLIGRVFVHLGVTGGMALGDTLVQQLVGQGLAARLSAKLGEGVVNGLLTARLGLAALDVVRPLPWSALARPAFADMMSELTRSAAFGRGGEPPAP